MRKTTPALTLALAALALTGTALTATSAHAVKPMITGAIAPAPIGHRQFCRDYPADCRIRSRRTAATELTRERWDQLTAVNEHVNRIVQPVTDQEYYATEEFWTYPGEYGDCEDYVLMKRELLMKQGWPASSLLITVVRQRDGSGHAVLTVRTSRGEFVLDNLDYRVRPWTETPYRYVRRQSASHSGRWKAIRDNRARAGS